MLKTNDFLKTTKVDSLKTILALLRKPKNHLNTKTLWLSSFTKALTVIGILAVTIGLSSCLKDPFEISGEEITTMPPYTETGSNTVACKVNGRVFINKIYYDGTMDKFFKPLYVIYKPNENYIQIDGLCSHYKKNNHVQIENVIIDINSIIDTGKVLKKDRFVIFYSNDYLDYGNRIGSTYQIEILKNDTHQHIFSGKFSGKLTNQDYVSKDTQFVTEGFFDVSYVPIR